METKADSTLEIGGRETPSVGGLPLFGNLFDFRKYPIHMLYEGWKQVGDVYKWNWPQLFLSVNLQA
jgi:hypothetical protein